MAERTREGTFEICPLLGWLGNRRGVRGVEQRIAIQEVSGTVELRRASLRGDLNPGPDLASNTAPYRDFG